ncbi:DUF6377 domain-containing protein [Cesiribacter sp. SM1]|uniref:DUF6377 domain-containing protein n=1 Tax=Cesiribacter sp. SM1 TaxID=2861196 RepID=UPI001CD572DC|nr:DUF6377 domain-containing protein [Cesiribacter sp. SM1]
MNHKGILLILLFFANIPAALYASPTDSLLQELSRLVENREIYMDEKQDKIEQIRSRLQRDKLSLQEQFAVYQQLHEEHRTFKYDEAFANAVTLQQLAAQLNDTVRAAYAKLRLSHTLLSSGMYKEAMDSLTTVNPVGLPDSIKLDYYALMARAYYDLSGYTQDPYFSPRYIKTGEQYVDSALVLLSTDNQRFYTLRAMKHEVAQEPDKAKTDFQTILEKFNPSLNQYAMAANSLGNIYYRKGDKEKGIEMMARAAIADAKASVKEGVALMTLAEYLYNNGEEARAYEYIKQALRDADFYGAKQRKIQVAAILPVIEGERLATVESQRSRLLMYAIAVSVLSLLVVVFALIIYKQFKKLRHTQSVVSEANASLQKVNAELHETNAALHETNEKLLEANKIKEEYFSYSFNIYTDYLEKISMLKQGVHRKLMSRKYDEISHVMDSINLKKERENLYHGFDKMFLKLFPNFIPIYNSYFREEDRFKLEDDQTLSIELRIFALIRMGIQDHEQIAKILEYSVRTVYNYKTKVKNKSLLLNEEFEQKIMDIKAF